ncbi:MAG: HNH endonuclease [Candidatus Binatia bacterium]
MIHQVKLPELTRKRLTDVVALQMRLLMYASSVKALDQASCANYLDRCAQFRSRGGQIAAWLWRSSKRCAALQEFAQHAVLQEKRQWSKQLAREADALLRNPNGSFSPPTRKLLPAWQKAGIEFLCRFYDDLCSSAGLPGYLFSIPTAASFGRQEFLKEFVAENGSLYVCAVCDESGYRTHLDKGIYTDIDHYFPRSLYPHLSCHPYNLIPICHLCNSSIKRDKDPLQGRGKRLKLEDIFLPYRSGGIGTQTYLKVTLATPPAVVRLGKLQTREATDLRQKLAGLSNIYRIPERWEKRIDEIGEKLFRRMRQFFPDGQGVPLGFDMPQAVNNVLDQLLFYLNEEDQGRDPFAFAMTWWLATLINQEVAPRRNNRSNSSSPLLAEIANWIRQDLTSSRSRLETARNIRKIASGNNATQKPV